MAPSGRRKPTHLCHTFELAPCECFGSIFKEQHGVESPEASGDDEERQLVREVVERVKAHEEILVHHGGSK